jgi:hypothetical protein
LMGSSKGKGRSGADLLLVVGTSLRVPGTKRMVREFSKAVRSRASNSTASTSSTTSNSEEETLIKSIYLNLDFPVPTREWEGVFDAWVQGDAQSFARTLHEEIAKESQAKELANERKRKREEEASSHSDKESAPKTPKKKGDTGQPSKKRKVQVTLPPTPPHTPPTVHSKPRVTLRLATPNHSSRTSAGSISVPGPRPDPIQPNKGYVYPSSSVLVTPPKSPPATSQFNMRTKAGRRAARIAQRARAEMKRSAAMLHLRDQRDDMYSLDSLSLSSGEDGSGSECSSDIGVRRRTGFAISSIRTKCFDPSCAHR